MKFETLKAIGSVTKPRVKAYRSNPGDAVEAIHAAAHYAAKNNETILVVPGNSYGHFVFHLSRTNEDLRKYVPGIGDKTVQIYVVKPDGKAFTGMAAAS